MRFFASGLHAVPEAGPNATTLCSQNQKKWAKLPLREPQPGGSKLDDAPFLVSEGLSQGQGTF